MQNQNAILIKNAEYILQTKIRLWFVRYINSIAQAPDLETGFLDFLRGSIFVESPLAGYAPQIFPNIASLRAALNTPDQKQYGAYLDINDYASLLVLGMRYCVKNGVEYSSILEDVEAIVEEDFKDTTGKDLPTHYRFLYALYYSEYTSILPILGPGMSYPKNNSIEPIPRIPDDLFTSNVAVAATKSDNGKKGVVAEYSFFVPTTRNISKFEDAGTNLCYRIEGNTKESIKTLSSDQLLKNKTFFVTTTKTNNVFGNLDIVESTTYLCYYDEASKLDLTHLTDSIVELSDGVKILAEKVFTTETGKDATNSISEELVSPADNQISHAFFERFYVGEFSYIANKSLKDQYFKLRLNFHNLGSLVNPLQLPVEYNGGSGEHYKPDFTRSTDKVYYEGFLSNPNKKEEKPLYNFSSFLGVFNATPMSLEEYRYLSSRLDVALYYTIQTYL